MAAEKDQYIEDLEARVQALTAAIAELGQLWVTLKEDVKFFRSPSPCLTPLFDIHGASCNKKDAHGKQTLGQTDFVNYDQSKGTSIEPLHTSPGGTNT